MAVVVCLRDDKEEGNITESAESAGERYAKHKRISGAIYPEM